MEKNAGFEKWLKKVNPWILIFICVLFCAFLGWLGVFVEYEFTFSTLYILPVMAAAWFGRLRFGIAVSVLAALTWFVGDLFAGRDYSRPFIPYINTAARIVLFIAVSALVNAVRKSLEMEIRLANEDFLTKISNSRGFFRYAEMELNRLKRYKKPFTIVYLDADNFKSVNDMHGHKAGDLLLVEIARIIRKHIRPTDMVARLGGDEFGVILIEAGPLKAKKIAGKIYRMLGAAMKKKHNLITFSFGVVTFMKPARTVDDVIKKADDLMYAAKHGGKDRINYSVYG
ncbi:MAG: putative diguanylate cyclase YcdT [Candidatus Aerophobetes bacterium ADurb.Bin490]|nr:MAG: putative diguanylate cyclase YcdT [Candidatus Aerophobetes bacterium ADurb.Bin490]HPI04238.1 diguanylate cyclase [Candidatus Goldiibacteriota bacterium]HPN65438.1 diguanylate cyclase [Candidatus Goldiibacteriota bacterium]HRQ44852.1 diguanylate cyclase [Candidatus Goldiibacteriota bacterium]